MKKIVMASAVMAATAMAGDFESRPEASVPTPVERSESLDKVPKMSEKENVDWQKMREERRIAREQILKDLRNNSVAQKKEMREAIAKPAVSEIPPVAEKPLEKNVEKPKDELVREKKMDEKEPLNNPRGGFGKAKPVTGTTGINKVNADTNAKLTIYDLQGRRVEKATRGIYIVNGNTVVIK